MSGLIKKRDDLWDKLHTHLAENKAVYDKEKAIRAEIKELQQQLYNIQMTPILVKLESDIELGNLEGEKLENAKLKVKRIKEAITTD